MKKFHLTGKALLLFALLALCACKPNPKEILSRKWKPVDVTGKDITPDMKANIVKDGYLIEFTKDGKFKTYAAGESTETSTYELTEDGKTILLTTAGDMEVKMEIKELHPHRAIIEANERVFTYEPAN